MVECKWYNKSWQTTDNWTIKLSLLKVKDLIEWADVTKTIPFFVIRLRDGFYYWRPDRQLVTTATFEMGGRTDRGLGGDVEPMITIPEYKWDCFYVGQVSI